MEKEKGIDRKMMLEAIESALLLAARKSVQGSSEVRVKLDPKSGKIDIFAAVKVVDTVKDPAREIQLLKARQRKIDAQIGDTIEIEVVARDFGRIAAQVFKQTINQILRGIEKTKITEEFQDRVGDIVTGTVRRFERSDVIVDFGKFEGIMPHRERVPTEEYNPGDKIRAIVLSLDNTVRGPQVILSRSHPNFVRRLLELEVSELKDKAVEIKAIAREPGYRTKIAVWSNDSKVDPVGACVGIRGSRVKNIVRELNNEKIDLFRWSPNIQELVIEALKPAKLKKLEINESAKRVKVFVDEENLSLAIGRRGQNARLASKLTGWEIDVEKEVIVVQNFEQKLEEAVNHLSTRLNVDHDTAQKVATAGFASIDDIVESSEDDLIEALDGQLEADVIKSLHAAAVAAKQGAQA
jgi:N utilization substance protein A